MSDPKQDAIEATAERLNQHYGWGSDYSREVAKRAVEAAEESWPHDVPQRDPTSCTNIHTQQAWAPAIGFTGNVRRGPLRVTS
jgi:hypothetical protein